MKRIRNEKLLKDFGAQVRTIRQSKNMTLEALAEAAGIEYSQVIRVEAGKVNATISTIEAIAKGLNVGIGDFFAG
jgi:transcriptional regulator with XRE-family HTH domain